MLTFSGRFFRIDMMVNDLCVLAGHDVLPVDCVLEAQQFVVVEHDIAVGDFCARTHIDKHSAAVKASISYLCGAG